MFCNTVVKEQGNKGLREHLATVDTYFIQIIRCLIQEETDLCFICFNDILVGFKICKFTGMWAKLFSGSRIHTIMQCHLKDFCKVHNIRPGGRCLSYHVVEYTATDGIIPCLRQCHTALQQIFDGRLIIKECRESHTKFYDFQTAQCKFLIQLRMPSDRQRRMWGMYTFCRIQPYKRQFIDCISAIRCLTTKGTVMEMRIIG